MKKLLCLIFALTILTTACGRNDDKGNGNAGNNEGNTTMTDKADKNNDEMGNGTADDGDGILNDAADGLAEGTQDITNGAKNVVDDAARGVQNTVDDMTK